MADDAHGRLARSLLRLAFRDAQQGDTDEQKEARWFLLQDQEIFSFWCHTAGVDPNYLRGKAKEELKRF